MQLSHFIYRLMHDDRLQDQVRRDPGTALAEAQLHLPPEETELLGQLGWEILLQQALADSSWIETSEPSNWYHAQFVAGLETDALP